MRQAGDPDSATTPKHISNFEHWTDWACADQGAMHFGARLVCSCNAHHIQDTQVRLARLQLSSAMLQANGAEAGDPRLPVGL